MNIILRFVYLLGGAAGLGLLFNQVVKTFPNVNPLNILFIAIPDLLLFFLAYKTYPAEEERRRYR